VTCWVLGLAKQAFYRGVRRPNVLSVRSARVPGPGRWCEITALRTRASRWPICARAGCGVTAATHAIALREPRHADEKAVWASQRLLDADLAYARST
jgi:hypothetical protein